MPKHEHGRDEVHPYENEVFVIDTYKHGMNAVGKRELIIMSSNSKFGVWVDVNVADIDFALMIVNIINFSFVVSYLSFIDF